MQSQTLVFARASHIAKEVVGAQERLRYKKRLRYKQRQFTNLSRNLERRAELLETVPSGKLRALPRPSVREEERGGDSTFSPPQNGI